jgi:hypothetical protein
MKWTSTCLAGWMCLALCAASPLAAAPVVDTLRVDLDSLIDKAARTREQFAVNLPHSVSSATQGSWSRRGSTSTWVYSTRVPTVISMSFHAPRIVLPPSAVFTVSTDRTTVKYSAHDIGRRGLWARPLAGDTLKLSLAVNTAEASEVHVYIDSVQAGYRSLGGGVPDHPPLPRAEARGGSGFVELHRELFVPRDHRKHGSRPCDRGAHHRKPLPVHRNAAQ